MSGPRESEPDLPSALRERVDLRYRNFAGRGWWPILDRLHERLLSIDADYHLHQIKEKLGVLRIYFDEEQYSDRPQVLEEIEAAIFEAVRASAFTCELCGEPGRLRNDEEWLRQRAYLLTLCDRCAPLQLAEWRSAVRAFVAEFIEGEDE